jgi:hypothetical protein
MKVSEVILQEEQIQEVPQDVKQFGKKLAAKTLARLPGAKGVAKGLATQYDVDEEANRIVKGLKQTLAGARKKFRDLDDETLATFLVNVGYDKNDIRSAIRKFAADGNLDKKTVDKIVLALTREAYEQSGGDVDKAKYAAGSGKKKVDPKDRQKLDKASVKELQALRVALDQELKSRGKNK